MTDPPTLFDAAGADHAATQAITRAGRHADPDWMRAALAAVHWCATRYTDFTTDAVWERLLLQNVAPPREERALGAVMRHAARRHWIVATDRYVKSARRACHARDLRVWHSRIYQEARP